jgi:hypothetical protein
VYLDDHCQAQGTQQGYLFPNGRNLPQWEAQFATSYVLNQLKRIGQCESAALPALWNNHRRGQWAWVLVDL